MNVQPLFPKLLALTILMLAITGARATAAPVPHAFGPVTIVSCTKVDVAGHAQAGTVRIKYFNNTKDRVLTSVVFAVHYHGLWAILHDYGHFTSHALINHTFSGLKSRTYNGSNPSACLVSGYTSGRAQATQ